MTKTMMAVISPTQSWQSLNPASELADLTAQSDVGGHKPLVQPVMTVEMSAASFPAHLILNQQIAYVGLQVNMFFGV